MKASSPHPPGAAASTASVLERIAGRYSGLSQGHRRIADLILSSPHEAALMTLKDLASSTGVSEATANRFSGRLGLQGHPELRRLLHEELRDALKSIESLGGAISRTQTSGDAWRLSLQEDAARIQNIAPLGGWGGFARASTALASARTVYFLGFGSSAYLAQYAEFCLSSLRPDCRAITDASGPEGFKRRLLDAGPEDVAVQIAFARYSHANLTAAQDLKSARVPLIAVTDDARSPLVPFSLVTVIAPRKPGYVVSAAGAGAVAALDALIHGTIATLGQDVAMRRSARLTSSLGETVIEPKGERDVSSD